MTQKAVVIELEGERLGIDISLARICGVVRAKIENSVAQSS